jgi:hypothetical protein
MNDIFHERHMNNIIAADREQNIHVRPTTSMGPCRVRGE